MKKRQACDLLLLFGALILGFHLCLLVTQTFKPWYFFNAIIGILGIYFSFLISAEKSERDEQDEKSRKDE
jgi:hypothetical protein